MQHLIFEIGKTSLAVPICEVREVIPAPEIQPVPQSPAYLAGVITVRGHSLGVMDLAKRLGLERNPGTARGHVMILRSGDAVLGALADRVADILEIGEAETDSSADVSGRLMQGGLISSVARSGGRTIFILRTLDLFESGGRPAGERKTA